MVALGFVPYNLGDLRHVVIFLAMIVNFIGYSCDTKSAILTCTATGFIMECLGLSMILKEGFSVGMLAVAITDALFLVLVLTVLSMMLVYIA